MKSFLAHIHAAQELDAMSHQEGLWIEIDLLEIRRCLRNLAAKMELLANFCYLNHSGVCSISEDFKEARPHYGVPHTTEVLLANTESHGLCSVRVRCERGRRVLSFLAEKNSRPKHEIRYTRLPTKITNYSCAE